MTQEENLVVSFQEMTIFQASSCSRRYGRTKSGRVKSRSTRTLILWRARWRYGDIWPTEWAEMRALQPPPKLLKPALVAGKRASASCAWAHRGRSSSCRAATSPSARAAIRAFSSAPSAAQCFAAPSVPTHDLKYLELIAWLSPHLLTLTIFRRLSSTYLSLMCSLLFISLVTWK